MVRWIVRLENLILALAAFYFYRQLGGSWLILALLILIPDVSMAGYLKDKRLGSIIYNLGHNYLLALGIVVIGWLSNSLFWVEIGLILVMHVGLDRLLGFGLKYPTDFKATHMQKL